MNGVNFKGRVEDLFDKGEVARGQTCQSLMREGTILRLWEEVSRVNTTRLPRGEGSGHPKVSSNNPRCKAWKEAVSARVELQGCGRAAVLQV